MQEELISLETAVLAKGKGYTDNSKYWAFFDKIEKSWFATNIEGGISGKENTVKRPPQSLLQRWLREVHSIIVQPNNYGGTLFPHLSFNCEIRIPFTGNFLTQVYDSYEEALEAGLQEALKLI